MRVQTLSATVVTALVVVTGCSTARPERSELQLRELQTRTYATTDEKMVMKAVLNVLDDHGYIVKTSNTDLGQITATKQEQASPEWAKVLAGVNFTRIVQCSVHVSRQGNQTRVRAVFEGQLLDKNGNIAGTEHADDPVKHGKMYQQFFGELDKALFIQQQNL